VKAKTELKAARDNLLQIPMSRTLKSSMAPFLALLALSLMAGCAVGPNFKKPAAPDVGDYTGGGLSATVAGNNLPGGESQRSRHQRRLVDAVPLQAAQRPDRAVHSPTITTSRRRRRHCRWRGKTFWLNEAFTIPSHRQAFWPPPAAIGAIAPVPSSNAFLYSLFTPQVSVSYVPDVFGLNRRTVESVKAQEQAVVSR
jgi:hypothetical protein